MMLAYKKERSAVSICCFSPLHRLSERRDKRHNLDIYRVELLIHEKTKEEIMTVYVTVPAKAKG